MRWVGYTFQIKDVSWGCSTHKAQNNAWQATRSICLCHAACLVQDAHIVWGARSRWAQCVPCKVSTWRAPPKSYVALSPCCCALGTSMPKWAFWGLFCVFAILKKILDFFSKNLSVSIVHTSLPFGIQIMEVLSKSWENSSLCVLATSLLLTLLGSWRRTGQV